MDISLSPDNEKFIQSQIAAGIYKTISEAVNGIIHLAVSKSVISQEQIDALKKDIALGLEDVRLGRVHDGIAFMDKLIAEYE